MTQPSFSSIFTTLFFSVNTDILANSYLFLVFPEEFDNFNNVPISIVIKQGGAVVSTTNATVIDRTLEILMSTLITANNEIEIQFPSLPTPKNPCSVAMSKMIGYLTPNDKKSIYAASSESGNSAPLIEFAANSRYIQFNSDQTITITAGTYSLPIYIQASDSNPFLTNININISSTGFTFEPSSVFLKLGDKNSTFRVGADSGLLPINYFYDTTKSEEITTYYTITKGNNINVTNLPRPITVPSSINVPVGGCSEPVILDSVYPPFTDMSITFNYDNSLYDEDSFWPNPHTTKTEMLFTSSFTQSLLSFCSDSSMSPVSFPLKLVLGGTDYKSYEFTPSENITINIVPNTSVPTPQISMVLANRQKTFLEFNITTNVDGNIYYHVQLGKDQEPLDEIDVKVKIKNHEEVIESMEDFMTERLYVDERHSFVGHMVESAGTTDKTRFSDLLPNRFYTFCFYLETHYN